MENQESTNQDQSIVKLGKILGEVSAQIGALKHKESVHHSTRDHSQQAEEKFFKVQDALKSAVKKKE
ncbi:MAG: hypothetical protein NTW98_02555 [Candidatus Nomurabacteria bacterium]|nr:hypothetical protein [Candidatus Nomurabacteria bacterium]